MSFTVAIIGRPNVGKSTLFNRLVGKRLAIVHDKPGVTRDRKEGQASLAGMTFRVIDTAGLEEAFDDSIEGRMRSQTERALQDADVALMLIDARAGVTPLDKHFADLLRKSKTPVILVANKCEGRAGQPGLYEAYGLGLGEPVAVSAEHGEGMYELFEALRPFSKEEAETEQDESFPEEPDDAALPDEEGGDEDELPPEDEAELRRPLQLAIVGRPNVGKSTLVNRLLGEERVVTGPEAGLTRDAITVEWEYQGRPIRLVDTAGMRRRSVITDQVEKLSVAESLESIRMAQVVVLVLDSSAILDKQDLTIARMVIEEGRALVIAINKWDVVEDRAEAIQRLNDRLESSLPQVRGIPTVTMSALTGRGVDKLMNAVIATYDIWRKRIPTGQLNRWLEEMTERHPPPVGQQGKRIRLRYMTQAKSRPPTFIIFTTRPEELPESYSRYLVNGMRDVFDMPGVPIRFFLRKRKNPYVDD